MMYKIINDLADIPSDTYLTTATTRTRAIYLKKLWQYTTRSDTFKYSMFQRPKLCGILTWYSSNRGCPLFHSKLGRGWSASRVRGSMLVGRPYPVAVTVAWLIYYLMKIWKCRLETFLSFFLFKPLSFCLSYLSYSSYFFSFLYCH